MNYEDLVEEKMAGFVMLLSFVGVILGIVVVVRMLQELYTGRQVGRERN